MSASLSYLTSIYSSMTGGSSSMLETLYGLGGQAGGASGQDPITALQSAETNEAQEVKATAAQPTVLRDINAFTEGVKSATSVAQLLANPAVMKVLLTANGLGDQASYTALATKALTSDLTDPKSLANTLPNASWKSTAATYNFATKGLSVIQDPNVIATITQAYAQVTWQKSQDANTPGLSNALAFRAEASKITSTDQILGDPVMRDVVTTTLGLPLEIAFQPITTQENAINSRQDVTQFQDPKYVERFLQRYLIAKADSPSTSSTPTLTSLASQASGGLG